MASTDSHTDYYVHPRVSRFHDPVKGTGVMAEAEIKRGTLVFLDDPWALVPTVGESNTTLPLCSWIQCNKVVHRTATTVTCDESCLQEIVWCNTKCQKMGMEFHRLECAWLQTFAQELRNLCPEYFWSLWLIVRVLARQHLESPVDSYDMSLGRHTKIATSSTIEGGTSNGGQEIFSRNIAKTTNGISTLDLEQVSHLDPELVVDNRFPCDSTVFSTLRSNETTLQSQKLSWWRLLIAKYLRSGSRSTLTHSLSDDELLTLFCRVEINHHDLWPQVFGLWPLQSLPINRTECCYAYAMYLRTLYINHSCQPNLIHQPDGNARMMFIAAKDIAAGEELTEAYFDLADPRYADYKERRAYLEDEFRFTCVCARCLEESGGDTGGGLNDIWLGMAVLGDVYDSKSED